METPLFKFFKGLYVQYSNNIGWNNLKYDQETKTFVSAQTRSECDRENDFEHIGARTTVKSCYKSNVVNETLYDEFDVTYPHLLFKYRI